MSLLLIGHLGGAAARRVGEPAPVSVTGGSHLLGGGFSSLLYYTFSVYGPLSLCKPDMWTIFGCFQLAPCRNRHSPKLMEFYQLNP
jgi:hypothetical protein